MPQKYFVHTIKVKFYLAAHCEAAKFGFFFLSLLSTACSADAVDDDADIAGGGTHRQTLTLVCIVSAMNVTSECK